MVVIEGKEYELKVKPFVFNLIPWLNSNTCQAIYPYIYVPKSIYRSLTINPDIKLISVLVREQTHLDQQKIISPLKFYLKYIFNKKFRYDEEIRAYRNQKEYLIRSGSFLDEKRVAKLLSGWLYL